MAATGYDVETQRGLRARDPHEVLVLDEYGYQAVFAPLRNISIGETLTVLTLLYVSTIAAFNAAYFANVPGNFAEFFSLTDLIQTNIPILQYFFSLALTYFLAGLVISFVGATTGFDLREKIRDITEPLILKYHLQAQKFWLVYGLFVCAFWIVDSIFRALNVTNFSLLMLPTLVFQGVLIYFFWVGYKFEMLPAKTLIFAALLALFVSSINAGHAWIKSQVAEPSHIQAIQDKDGVCLDRNILRNSSTGLLLYNPSMKQFEFRSKDTIKTIYQGRGCT
jgi:hypothetical protein